MVRYGDQLASTVSNQYTVSEAQQPKELFWSSILCTEESNETKEKAEHTKRHLLTKADLKHIYGSMTYTV